jgi:hypothetical protein
MNLEIPQYTAIKYMVYDSFGAVRGFETKEEANKFAEADSEYQVKKVERKIKSITIEEAPF